MTRRPAAPTRRTFVVDHYRPGLSGDELRHLAERVRDAVVDMGRTGVAIRSLSAAVVPEDDYFQSVIEAASEHLVREAHTRAGISFQRISAAIPIENADWPRTGAPSKEDE